METNQEIREDEFQKLSSSKSYLHQRDIDLQKKLKMLKLNHFYDSIPLRLRNKLNNAQATASICYSDFMQGHKGVRVYEQEVNNFEKVLKKVSKFLIDKFDESHDLSEIEDLKSALIKLPIKTFESLFDVIRIERQSSA